MHFFVFPFQVILSLLVAQAVGHKRKIGGGWTLFFCLVFSVIIGFFFAILSPIKGENKSITKVSDPRFILSLLVSFIGIAVLVGTIRMLISPEYTTAQVLLPLDLTVGVFGLAIYISFPNAFNNSLPQP